MLNFDATFYGLLSKTEGLTNDTKAPMYYDAF